MNKGFSYIVFLLFVCIMAIVVGTISFFIIRSHSQKNNDLDKLQSDLYAQSAIEYHKLKTNIPQNKMFSFTYDEIVDSPGVILSLNHGGFKIVRNFNNYYYLGFTGKKLEQSKAITIIEKEKGKYSIWQD